MILIVIKTEIQLFSKQDDIILEKGILIEGDGLCTIYAKDRFEYIGTEKQELLQKLVEEGIFLREVQEKRLCSKCGDSMCEGFYFESDNTQYCSEVCLIQVVSWEKYLEIHDDGNGDAYWTVWED